MKALLTVVLVAILLVHTVELAPVVADEVLELNKDNFQQKLYAHGSILAQFYSPTCLHCRKFSDDWEVLAKALKGKITLAKINVATDKSLAESYGVVQTPTIFLLQSDAQHSEYTGALTPEDIVKFVFRKTDPIILLTSKEEVEEFISSWDTTVVAFFEEPTRTTSRNTVWKQFRECVKNTAVAEFGFGVVSSPVLATQFQLRTPNMMVYKKWDPQRPSRITADDWSDLCAWIINEGSPIMEEFNPGRHPAQIIKDKLPIGLVFLDPATPKDNDKFLSDLYKTTVPYKGRMKFYYFTQGTRQIDTIKSYGGSGNLPTFVIRDPLRKFNYPFDDSPWTNNFSSLKIAAWTDAYFAKKLEPKIRSTPEAPVSKWASKAKHHHDGSHVQAITGKTFKDVVHDKTKDVLVEFFSPSCPNCQAFSSKLEAVGEAVCGVDTVGIVSFDATINEVPYDAPIGNTIRSYPTIKLFRALDKQNPIDYTGPRTSYDVLMWLKQQASIPFDISSDVDLSALENSRAEEKQRAKEAEEAHDHSLKQASAAAATEAEEKQKSKVTKSNVREGKSDNQKEANRPHTANKVTPPTKKQQQQQQQQQQQPPKVDVKLKAQNNNKFKTEL